MKAPTVLDLISDCLQEHGDWFDSESIKALCHEAYRMEAHLIQQTAIMGEMLDIIEAIASTDADTFYLVAGPNSRSSLVSIAEKARAALSRVQS